MPGTPEDRLKRKVDDATNHASESLRSYAGWTKAFADRLASPSDSDQSKLASDVSMIWAQMMKDAAYGWLTLYNMAQDVSEIQPTRARRATKRAGGSAKKAGGAAKKAGGAAKKATKAKRAAKKVP